MPAGDSGEAARFTQSTKYATIRAADAKRSAQRTKQRGRLGTGPRDLSKKASAEPVIGFIKRAVRNAPELEHRVLDIARDLGSDYIEAKKKDWLPQRQRGKPQRLATARTNELASGPKIAQIIRMGEAVLGRRSGQKEGLDEVRDMLAGLPPAVAKQHPGINRLYVQDMGYPWRLPFLTGKRHGKLDVGDFGETHGGLLRTKYPQGLTPELATRAYQGMIGRPDASALGRATSGVGRRDVGDIKLDLGYGNVWAEPPPLNIAPTHKFLMHLLRNYPDELVQVGAKGGRGGQSPSRDDMFEQWIEDMELGYKPHNFYRSFGESEKKRRRR